MEEMKNNKTIILVFALTIFASLLQSAGKQKFATFVGNLLFVFLFLICFIKFIKYFGKQNGT